VRRPFKENPVNNTAFKNNMNNTNLTSASASQFNIRPASQGCISASLQSRHRPRGKGSTDH